MLSKVWWIWVKILSVIGREVVHLVVLGPVVFCLVTCWISGFCLLVLAARSAGCLFGGVWSRESLFGDFGSSGKVCQVALGQEVVGLVVVYLLVFVQEVVCLECWVI